MLAVATLCYQLVPVVGVHRLYPALCSALSVLSHTPLPLEKSVQETGLPLHLDHPIQETVTQVHLEHLAQETGTPLYLKHPIQEIGTPVHLEHPVQEIGTPVHLEHHVQETVIQVHLGYSVQETPVLDQATEEVTPIILQVCEQESYQRILPALKVAILSVNLLSRYEHFSRENNDK